ncbi:galactose-3-O-sulfotransferase 2-like [Tiliqua scincoides]|uniref:galactose-3-O-sulfotransferase 2-like n=1 Tax=Tiliqua scincoides TaxID=71010 RepID=UPI0034617CB9
MIKYSSQLGKLWIALLLLFLLCVTLQIVEKFQYSSNCSCDLKLKQLALQESTANNNSFWDQKGPVLAQHFFSEPLQERTPKQLSPEPTFAEKNDHVIKLSNAFHKTELLDASLGSEEEFSKKKIMAHIKGMRILHPPNKWKHGTKKVPVGDQAVPSVTFPDSRKPADATKPGTSSVRLTEVLTGIAVDDPSSIVKDPLQNQTQALPSSIHKRGGTIRTISQTTRTLKDKRLTEMASTKLGSRPPPPEKVALPNTVGTSGASLSQGTTCKPKTHIVFLKMHKSASSTVMNILFRFGETHNLTFAFPIKGDNLLHYPHYFTAGAVEGFSPSKESKFNIMCHHMRFFQPQVARIMPNTTFYFSILRNPVHLMESSFTYFKGTSCFRKAQNLEQFLNQTSSFYNASASDSHYSKNLMTFDFGYNHNGNFSAKQVQLMLRAIEADFDLLLISEYFDESMVLLKEVLCWDLDDVVSFPLNSRHNSTKSSISESTAEKIKMWNKLDWEIYMHFNKTFWEKIDWHVGRERMKQEVRALRQKREQLAKRCLQGGGSVAPVMIRDQALVPFQYGNAKILGYNLNPGLDKTTRHKCQRLVTPELQYNKLLYRKQFTGKVLKRSNVAHLPKLLNTLRTYAEKNKL